MARDRLLTIHNRICLLLAFKLIHEILVCYLLPSHVLLTALIDGLFPSFTARTELAEWGVRGHVRELC